MALKSGKIIRVRWRYDGHYLVELVSVVKCFVLVRGSGSNDGSLVHYGVVLILPLPRGSKVNEDSMYQRLNAGTYIVQLRTAPKRILMSDLVLSSEIVIVS